MAKTMAIVTLFLLAITPALALDNDPFGEEAPEFFVTPELDLAIMSMQPEKADAGPVVVPAVQTSETQSANVAPATTTCNVFLWSESCQTGGWWTGSCPYCGGATCYFRYEGTLDHYATGNHGHSIWKAIRCYTPPWKPNCNSTCFP